MTILPPPQPETRTTMNKTCPNCDEPVDADGVTLGECPNGSGEKCPSCYYCYCDGSCC